MTEQDIEDLQSRCAALEWTLGSILKELEKDDAGIRSRVFGNIQSRVRPQGFAIDPKMQDKRDVFMRRCLELAKKDPATA